MERGRERRAEKWHGWWVHLIAAGIFLITHGLLHLAIWLPPAAADAPFDPRHSWAFGDVATTARGLALVSCGLFVAAGLLLLSGSDSAVAAVIASVVSGSLIALTFNPWFVGALVINAVIVVVALTWRSRKSEDSRGSGTWLECLDAARGARQLL